jgi:DNA-binding MarR family transcriptional regulator
LTHPLYILVPFPRNGGSTIEQVLEPTASENVEPVAEAWRRMRELAHHPDVLRRVHALAEEVGLTPGITRALVHLSPGRPMPMRELAGALRCDNSYVTTVVDSLERQGMVRRLPHPTDRRIKIIELTDAGRLLATRVHDLLDEPPVGFASLSGDEADELLRIMRKLSPDADALS